MGERERERESVLKSVCFVCKRILKNYRNARSVYIASQKAWFKAFIATIKKVKNTPKRGNNSDRSQGWMKPAN